ncbi:MAG: GNAT family N-acetyltransferase [Lachnospiraceae bacterium]|nr:GNAT family N-acetyltransferase [Lachnospiraceae bacterium]
MEIRHSQERDLERIMEIYSGARRFMAEHGNPRQWGATNWPPEELIRKDIRTGKSYVCIANGHVAGTFFYDYGDEIEPAYGAIKDGAWKMGGPYGVVHRVASDGSVRGIGSFCLNWAFEQCAHLRIDTHGDNKVMQKLLKGLGFEQRGIVFVEEDNEPRLAFERAAEELQSDAGIKEV